MNDIASEKINNKKEAEEVYLKDIFEYKKVLERQKIYPNSRTQRMKRFIEKAEYILFGPLLLESEKLDIATGGYDPDQTIPLQPSETEKRQKGQGLKLMKPKQMITRLPILLAQLKAGNNSNTLKM